MKAYCQGKASFLPRRDGENLFREDLGLERIQAWCQSTLEDFRRVVGERLVKGEAG